MHILHWALNLSSSLPPLLGTGSNTQPSAKEISSLIQHLAAQALSQLNLMAPPLGDNSPPGWGTAMMAMALVNRENKHAFVEIVGHIGPVTGYWDSLARYRLLQRSLHYLDPPHREALWASSPLHCLFHFPPEHQQSHYLGEAQKWLKSPGPRQALLSRLGTPTNDFLSNQWRKFLLQQLRLSDAFGKEAVLDVFEYQLSWHRDASLQSLAIALERANGAKIDDESKAILELWGILATLAMQDDDWLHRRAYLDLTDVPILSLIEAQHL